MCIAMNYQDKAVIEHKTMVESIVKLDEKCYKRIKAAGIDNECPALVSKPCVTTFSLFNIYKCEDVNFLLLHSFLLQNLIISFEPILVKIVRTR
jgi:hypothetical protein